MSSYPRLLIDLGKIEHNAKVIADLSKNHGMTVMGVTKACRGDPSVASAMLRGGVNFIADSRLENIKRLRASDIGSDLVLLRTPMLSQVEDVVRFTDISLNSELKVISSLSEESRKRGTKHRIILMVELGDLREGVMPEKLEDTIEKILTYGKVVLVGLGINLACFGGVQPTWEKLDEFHGLIKKMEQKFSMEFEIKSGGNSANIPLLFSNGHQTSVNNIRVGEGILLGLETVNRGPIPGTYQDAFSLEAEVIELKEKPSVPRGRISQNVFGETPTFDDLGEIRRGILAIGSQDTIQNDLSPRDPNIHILGGSTDHTVVHVKGSGYGVGDILNFHVNYNALVNLFTSDYVKKEYI